MTMYENSAIGVVIPAYNEEDFIEETIETVPSFVDQVYPVDDASTDGTWEAMRRASDRVNQTDSHTFAEPIRHEANSGVGAAIKTGYAKAMEDGLDVIAVMNGDGQMNPDRLSEIIDPVVSGVAQYAKGNRLHRPQDRIGMPRFRLFGNSLLTMLTRISSGYWEMTDPQNGYTAISWEVLEMIPYNQLYNRYGFLNDLLAMLNAYECTIADVCHPAVYGAEESGIRYSTFVPSLSWLLLRRFLWRMKTRYVVSGFHPLVACYPIGLLSLAIGVFAGVYSINTFSGSALIGLLSSMTVVLLGTIFIILGLWFDVQDNRELVIRRIPARKEPRSTSPRIGGIEIPVSTSIVHDGGRYFPGPIQKRLQTGDETYEDEQGVSQ